MNSLRNILTILLLLLVFRTTVAEDGIPMRGCRRGVLPSVTRTNRAAGVPKQVGGNFYVGDRRQLVLLVSFADQQFMQTDPLPVWDRIFNEPNYTEPPFYGSVYDYFYAQSGGQFRLSFDLLYIALDQNRERYHSTPGMDGDDENSQYLVNDLVDILQYYDIDWSLYDWDGNGYVNQLLIVYAGKGMNWDGDKNTIWPHQWWLSAHKKDHQPDVYCEPRAVTSGGKQYFIDAYCAVQEEAHGDYRIFGTICHEYTHCFGFPDFYYSGTKFIGMWDLMDYGNLNGDGYCPAGYSAHERWLMGWLTPIELTESMTVTDIPPLSEESRAYLIRNDDYSNEYYMIENRQPSQFDVKLPGSGLVVFHIDYDENVWLTGWPNSSKEQHYTIFPANNKSSTDFLSGWAYPFEENNSLTDTSYPAAKLWHVRSDGSTLMSKSLTNMTVNSDGMASFDFMMKESGIHDFSMFNGQCSMVNGQCYDLQGRKFSGCPLQKGLYILNGCKMVVK